SVAYESAYIGKRVREYPVVTGERGGRITIERCSDRGGERIEVHRLGVQHAVAISKGVHHTLSLAERREEYVGWLNRRQSVSRQARECDGRLLGRRLSPVVRPQPTPQAADQAAPSARTRLSQARPPVRQRGQNEQTDDRNGSRHALLA